MKPLTLEQKEARKVYRRAHYLANRERTLAVNQVYRERNPELIKRLKVEWADKNREKVNAQCNERRRANPEAYRQYHAEYREKNPSVKEYQRDYYMKNSDSAKQKSAKWQKDNAERNNAAVRERLLTKWLFRAGWTREEYNRRVELGCEICGVKVKRGGATGLVFDHDHDTGLVRGLLCGKCNARLDWAIQFYEEIGCYHRFSLEAAA